MGVYEIDIDGKKYIGSSKDLKKRIMSHLNALEKNNHKNKIMQSDYNKVGTVSAKVIKVVTIAKYLQDVENYFIGRYNSIDCGYNSFLSSALGNGNAYRFNEKQFDTDKIYTMQKEG